MASKDLPLPQGCVPACRACPHRSWDLDASVAQKTTFLEATLAPWASVLLPILSPPPERRWHYRSRARVSVRWLHGRWAFGMEPRGDFIALPECPIHESWVNETFRLLLTVMPPHEEFPLRYLVQAGGITTLIVKTSPQSASAFLPDLVREVGQLQLPEKVQAVWLHAHPAAGNRLFAKPGWFSLRGSSWCQDERGFYHGPTAFQQTMPEMALLAEEKADAWLKVHPASTVVDLYCGIGVTMRRWTAAGARVFGVEATPEAVAAAQKNAPLAKALIGYCTSRLPQLRQWTSDLLGAEPLAYVNPPRMGLEPEVIQWLTDEYRPTRLAYLSCSAGTLKRDLEHFTQHGYRVANLQPYDFFPQTQHVEVLACLERSDSL